MNATTRGPRRVRRWAQGAVTVAMIATAAAPRAAPAQVRGVVVDPSGRPIPGVLVELWDAARRLAGDATDVTGHFRLGARAIGPRALLARSVGFDPLRQLLVPGDSVVRLVMQPRPLEIEAWTISTKPTACPQGNEPRARALWERAARHYDVALSAYGVETDIQRFASLVPIESLGVVDTTRLENTFIRHSSNAPTFDTRFTTAPYFYGVRAFGARLRRVGQWHYPLLESTQAWHFADSMFAALNKMALIEPEEGLQLIAFCSRWERRPYVQGRLRIAPDTTFASAEWEYVTPAPTEMAGGLVLFAPVNPGATGQPLLAVAGFYWRGLVRSAYQEWMEYRQWYRCEAPGRCSAPVPLR